MSGQITTDLGQVRRWTEAGKLLGRVNTERTAVTLGEDWDVGFAVDLAKDVEDAVAEDERAFVPHRDVLREREKRQGRV